MVCRLDIEVVNEGRILNFSNSEENLIKLIEEAPKKYGLKQILKRTNKFLSEKFNFKKMNLEITIDYDESEPEEQFDEPELQYNRIIKFSYDKLFKDMCLKEKKSLFKELSELGEFRQDLFPNPELEIKFPIRFDNKILKVKLSPKYYLLQCYAGMPPVYSFRYINESQTKLIIDKITN